MLRLTGELEQLVLRILKDQNKPLKPADVQELIKPYKNLAYTTVMTVLKRLYEKHLLKRAKQGTAYTYSFLKSDISETNLKTIFDDLLDSYGNLAISNFFDSANTKPEHKKMLKEYLKHAKK